MGRKIKNFKFSILTSFIFAFLGTTFLFGSPTSAMTSRVNITRSSSDPVRLTSGGSTNIEPSPTGTLATGSDTVNVNTNCSAGYDLYISSTSTGSTDLVLSGAATPVASNNKIEASSNTVASPSTLAKDTWGVGKTDSSFSGLQAYNANIASLTPFYHDTTIDGKDFTFYYGANLSTDKTPGRYNVDILYTVLAKPSCVEYTLSFDTSSATSVLSPGTYTTRTIGVDELVNLATLSSTSNIRRSGYRITGWRNKNNTSETYGTIGSVDVNPNDLSTITLEPTWALDSYTLTVSGGIIGTSGSKTSGSYTAGSSVTITANSPSTGYHFSYWSSNNGGSFASTYSSSTTFTMPSNSVTVTANIAPNPFMQDISVTDLAEGQTTPVRDRRDNQDYTVYRWPSTGTAGTDYPTGMAGYAIMTKDLSLGYVTGGSVTKGANLTLTTTDSAGNATITAGAGSGWGDTDDDDHKLYINGNGDAYDSHSYYSYRAAQAVCPKGWRLPTKTEYDSIATFMGGNNATGSSTIRNAPYNFIYGGAYLGNMWYGKGDVAVYWSATPTYAGFRDPENTSYFLSIASSELFTSDERLIYNRSYGFSVRCVTDSDAPLCSNTIYPTTSLGCRMADGKIWILGNNGNTITWNNMFTGATGVEGHDATLNSGICPSGYSAPNDMDYHELIQVYGGKKRDDGYIDVTDALSQALGISNSARSYWSSTESSSSAWVLEIYDRGYSSSEYTDIKAASNYALCLK